MEYTVRSSHGVLTIDKDGYVTERQIDNQDSDGGNHLALITRFDLVEWQHHWNNPEGNSIDILDLGYWYDDPNADTIIYAEPDANWRKEIVEILLKRKRADCIHAAAPKLLAALINLTERIAKTRREAGELAILDEWEAANAIIAEVTGSAT